MTEWTPNENQKKFLEVVSNEPMTLAELNNRAGMEFATGSINVLAKKGLVGHGEDRTLVCPCCGHKKKVKTWIKL
jgi:hypothetical protein